VVYVRMFDVFYTVFQKRHFSDFFGIIRVILIWQLHCHSLHFNGRFPGGPGLAGTRMFLFWILLKLRMVEVVVTTGAVIRAKFQSNHH